MKTLPQKSPAYYVLIALCAFSLGYHVLIVLQFIPYEMTWGGRLKSVQEMYIFESISIVVNLIFLFLLWQELRWFYWVVFVVFFLNTIGNAVSTNFLEKVIFTPVTALACLCGLWLALQKRQ